MPSAEARQETVETAKGNRQKPENDEAIAEPTLNSSLGGSLEGLPGEEQVRRAVNPREAAEAGHQIPEGGFGAASRLDAGTTIEEADHPDADHQEGKEEHRRGPVRVLEPLHPGGVSREDGKRAEQDGKIPENDR